MGPQLTKCCAEEAGDRDHKSLWNQLTELLNQVRSRLIFTWPAERIQVEGTSTLVLFFWTRRCRLVWLINTNQKGWRLMSTHPAWHWNWNNSTLTFCQFKIWLSCFYNTSDQTQQDHNSWVWWRKLHKWCTTIWAIMSVKERHTMCHPVADWLALWRSWWYYGLIWSWQTCDWMDLSDARTHTHTHIQCCLCESLQRHILHGRYFNFACKWNNVRWSQ